LSEWIGDDAQRNHWSMSPMRREMREYLDLKEDGDSVTQRLHLHEMNKVTEFTFLFVPCGRFFPPLC
jgi:hypothetical protein